MSPSLPRELFDLIIDCLRDELATLSVCCLLSKAWVQHPRKYLFASIKFSSHRRHVEQWERTFPDPTNSPAHNTRILYIPRPNLITAAYVDTLLTFSGVVRLDLDTRTRNDQRVSLAPLHGFSPALKSLHFTFASLPNTDIFDLVCSFPLLEDLTLIARSPRHHHPARNGPTSPRFTGSFELNLREEIYPTVDQMLGLPNGLHFTSITVSWYYDRDIFATMRLVSKCSTALESISIANYFRGNAHNFSIDLSGATGLRNLEFRCKHSEDLWISQMLRTINSEYIEQVSLDLALSAFLAPEGWLDLDFLLVQLWDLHSIRIKITYEAQAGLVDGRERVEELLPQVIERQIAELIEKDL